MQGSCEISASSSFLSILIIFFAKQFYPIKYFLIWPNIEKCGQNSDADLNLIKVVAMTNEFIFQNNNYLKNESISH